MEVIINGGSFDTRVTLDIQQSGNQSTVKVTKVEVKERALVNDGAGYIKGYVNLDGKPGATLQHDNYVSCGVSLSGYQWDGGGEGWSGYQTLPVVVTHAADGTGSVLVSINLSAITTRNIFIGNVNAEKRVELPITFPQEGTVPVIDIGGKADVPVTLGNVMKITLKAHLDTMTHALFYRLNGVETMIASMGSGVHEWTVPYSIAAVFPTMVNGIGEIVCRTYLGADQVGKEESVWFYYLVPDNDVTKPKITAFSVQPVALDGVLPTKFDGLYIHNVTKIRGDITAEGTYSPVREYRLAGSGISSDGSQTSPVYGASNVSGPVKVLGRVTDQRGFQRDSAEDIYVFTYASPSVAPANGNVVVCARCNGQGELDDNGTHLRIDARMIFSSIAKDGEELNGCRMEYRYKEAASESYSAPVALPVGGDMAVHYFSKGMILDLKHSYHVEIRAVDTIGKIGAVTIAVPSDSVTLHLKRGGKGAALFKRAERDGAFEVDGDILISSGNKFAIGNTEITEEQLKALLAMI